MTERAVVFDVMGTLFDLSALDERFEALGGGPATRKLWFQRTLDGARVLTVVGSFAPFRELALAALRSTLAQEGLDPDAAGPIVDAVSSVPAYPEAAEAVARVEAGGAIPIVLTNGGEEQTWTLLEGAGLAGRFVHVLSCEEVRTYKPAAAPYEMAVEAVGLPAGRVALVAAHGWDVVGAYAAGLVPVWVDRVERAWPFPPPEPEKRAPDLVAAVELALA